jgi:hypothetical protein
MLQIVTRMYSRTGVPLHSTVHRGVLYTNLSRLRADIVKLPIGELAVLGSTFRAFDLAPPLGVLVLAYLIGQLGGNIPIPGGIGGIDAGLIGVFVLYHQPLAVTTAAVLAYHAIALWVPALLGGLAFVQLRSTLRREDRPAAMCAPLAEPIEVVTKTVPAG